MVINPNFNMVSPTREVPREEKKHWIPLPEKEVPTEVKSPLELARDALAHLDELEKSGQRKETELTQIPEANDRLRAKVAYEGFKIVTGGVTELRNKLEAAKFDKELEAIVRRDQQEAEFDRALDGFVSSAASSGSQNDYLEKLKKLHAATKEEREFQKILKETRDELRARAQKRKEEEAKKEKETEETWFAQGEAEIQLGGEKFRVVEMENLGLEAKEAEQIEQFWAGASKHEARDMSAEVARTLLEKEIKDLKEFKELDETAKKLAKMEDEFADNYFIDADREKTSLAARFKNRLLTGFHRAFNREFAKKYSDYEKLQRKYNDDFKKLEEGGVFAGHTRVHRALDRRMRDILDEIRNRAKRIRG